MVYRFILCFVVAFVYVFYLSRSPASSVFRFLVVQQVSLFFESRAFNSLFQPPCDARDRNILLMSQCKRTYVLYMYYLWGWRPR